MNLLRLVSIGTGHSSQRDAASPKNAGAIYTDEDTGKVFYSDGQTWQPMGFSSGGGGLPDGVTGDGLTPGGLVLAGALTAGDPNAASVPSYIQFSGAVFIVDTPANASDGDDGVAVTQGSPLTADNFQSAASIRRNGALNGHDYLQPVLYVGDDTAATGPMFKVVKQSVSQFQVDGTGITAGDPNAASVPSYITLNGATTFQDTPANQPDLDDVVNIFQTSDLTQDATGAALFVTRNGTLHGHSYTSPMVTLVEDTASTSPALQVKKGSTTQFQVDGDGVQVHGKFKTGSSETGGVGASTGKRQPFYDEAGTLIGYADLMAAA